MAKQKGKRLITYISLLAVAAVVFLVVALLWQPFKAEKMDTYSNGLVGTYLGSHDESDAAYGIITAVTFALAAVAAYLLGSLNFAIITSHELYGDDVRRYGSKNAGMTNMFRVYGKKAGIFTLLGDTSKTAAAIFLGRLLGGETVAYLAAIFCVLGHIAPARYKFKGGKGVLSSAIAILCLDPKIFLCLLVVYGLVLLLSRYVSLASVVSAFVYPGLVIFFAQYYYGTPPALFPLIFSLFVGLFVIFSHRTNLQRISERTESKISFKRKKKDGSDTQK